MTFSIVIPTYNGSAFLAQALDSALNQSRAADEIIISDDNSTDETISISKEYQSRFPNQIKIHVNPDGPSGFVNGWKKAVGHASGEYISILHQDDLLYPKFLEEIERAISANPDARHFFSPCDIIDKDCTILRSPQDYCSGETYRFTGKEYATAYIRVKGHIHRCPGVVTHRDIFKYCNYREEAGHVADNDFFLRVGNYTDVVGVLKPLAAYREHISSETGHLSFFHLDRRLLDDYHFQLTHADENPLITPEIKQTFRKWESEYIHRLVIFGLKKGMFQPMAYGLRKWLSTDARYGNFRYDLKRIPNTLKDHLRELHIRYLRSKAKRLPEFMPRGHVVIIAPHPDDEVIGCAGLIQRLVADHRPPHIIILTGGEASLGLDHSISHEDIISHRRRLTRSALFELGLAEDHIHEFNLPDGRIAHVNDKMLTPVEECLRKLTPDTVLVPHRAEGWSDHVCVRNLISPFLSSSCEVWEYCVWMWYYNVWRGLEWENAAAIHLTPKEHQKKIRAVDAYVTPLSPCGIPWSGPLPPIFLQTARQEIEFYFKS